ncbi:MAG: 3-oxoacyl-[acyl-carrier protein] reductase [Chloroflexi bacterium]|jgi:3-oxoacyl-[acyl-carrier protein] reductase|nr:MAG: 3-oxoacyl-[acyl-carrier protein] reductase [Chloroflexota bacterium]
MAGRLDGRRAIITGGNSGIGETTAHTFAREGARVVIMARRPEQGATVQDAIRAEGGEASFVACDISDSASVETAVAGAVDLLGGVDILFNNAGYGSGESFPNESEENWRDIINVNLTGTFLMTQTVWPHLVSAGGGAVINMSSLAAQRGFSEAMQESAGGTASASYYAAKAGVDAFTRYAAGMGGRDNIRVNCVRPGQILTPGAVNPQTGNHYFKTGFDAFQILEGPGLPEDVANVVLFLASDESRFLTGELINIDGGCAAKI